VRLVGFITKKFVMIHGHMNVKCADCIRLLTPAKCTISNTYKW